MIRAALFVMLIAAMAQDFSAQQSATTPRREPRSEGLIHGTVVYPDRKPVDGATVYAGPFGRPIGLAFPHVQTDQTGQFSIRIPTPWFGKLFVAAEKKDEDYPDMGNQFYANGKFHIVTLTAAHPHAHVVIRLGPKAGVLEGTVTDAVTGSPLGPCTDLHYAASSNFLSGTGLITARYRLLLPSDTGILIKVQLDGYRPWYYPGGAAKSAAKPIWLRPAEEKSVDIRLQPDSRYADMHCPASLSRR